MSYLALAKRVIADLTTTSDPILDPEEKIGAVLLRSPRYGEVWLALDACAVPELRVAEQARETPRPVLLAEDVARLRGRSPEAVQAVLRVAAAFPGARVIQ